MYLYRAMANRHYLSSSFPLLYWFSKFPIPLVNDKGLLIDDHHPVNHHPAQDGLGYEYCSDVVTIVSRQSQEQFCVHANLLIEHSTVLAAMITQEARPGAQMKTLELDGIFDKHTIHHLIHIFAVELCSTL